MASMFVFNSKRGKSCTTVEIVQIENILRHCKSTRVLETAKTRTVSASFPKLTSNSAPTKAELIFDGYIIGASSSTGAVKIIWLAWRRNSEVVWSVENTSEDPRRMDM